jgi:FkbM family methyltransferase
MLSGLRKPWYVWRPWQVVLRFVRGLRPASPGYRPLRVAWGAAVLADPTKAIGRSIWTTGTYDLAVSEVLVRLIEPGDVVVDAGANIGYMTLLAATAAGPSGIVFSFEPHPELFAVLEQNVAAARRSRAMASTVLRNVALGDRAGQAELVLPAALADNEGVAHVSGRDTGSGRRIAIGMETIDDAIATRSVGMLKLDVEGYERQVLEGASKAMASRHVRHVVFEDHRGRGSDVIRLLESWGYEVYSVGWSVMGPRLGPIDGPPLAKDYEAPSYLATLHPDEARRRCARRGWLVLRRDLGRTATAGLSRHGAKLSARTGRAFRA